MRTLRNSRIRFNNTNGIYKPGDILTGHLEINLNSTKTVRALYYQIIGKASVYWSEDNSTTNSDGSVASSSTSYSSEEIYFKERFYVVGKDKSDEIVELSRGQHVFSFKYVLPSTNLPPTYEGSYGKITYSVKATLARPWKIDKHVEAPFIVEALLNIQDHPEANKPVIFTMEKQFGILFKSKPLKTHVKVPHSGFAPGQTIPLELQIMNKSNTAVIKISVKLIQVTTFHATSKDNRAEKTLSKNPILSQIKPNSSKNFNHNLQVPIDVILQDLSSCKIIDIDYEIRVELHTAGLTKNLIGKIPLYPIRSAS